ncbi:Hypothetical predicted protein, partial [Prunus dulcis]
MKWKAIAHERRTSKHVENQNNTTGATGGLDSSTGCILAESPVIGRLMPGDRSLLGRFICDRSLEVRRPVACPSLLSL